MLEAGANEFDPKPMVRAWNIREEQYEEPVDDIEMKLEERQYSHED
jgi:hypothetical protein